MKLPALILIAALTASCASRPIGSLPVVGEVTAGGSATASPPFFQVCADKAKRCVRAVFSIIKQ